MDPGDLVRVSSLAGFVFAFERAAGVPRKRVVHNTLALYVGPNPEESRRLGQPMVDILVGEWALSIDGRFLDAVHA